MPAVLIVDDDPVCRHYCVHALATLGYPTLAASNGSEAIQMAQRERPQVILVDMHLPDMSGITAMTRLLALWPDAKVDCRIIGLSGDDSPELRSAMQIAGFTSVLIKPCPVETLAASIRKAENDLGKVFGASDPCDDQAPSSPTLNPSQAAGCFSQRIKTATIRIGPRTHVT